MGKQVDMVADPEILYRVEGMTIEEDPYLVYRFEAPEIETIQAFYKTYAQVNSIIGGKGLESQNYEKRIPNAQCL